jgi:hypothetical protein
MYQTKIITDLTEEPVSLTECKLYMEIDYTEFDTLITRLIKAARIASEKFTGLSYGKKQIELVSNGNRVEIPLGPFYELVSIKDKDGNDISTDDYNLFGYESPILTVYPRNVCVGENYDPYYDILGTALRRDYFFTVVYNTGFYTQSDDTVTNTLPQDLKEAICKRVETAFIYRADATDEFVNKAVNTACEMEFGYRLSPMV